MFQIALSGIMYSGSKEGINMDRSVNYVCVCMWERGGVCGSGEVCVGVGRCVWMGGEGCGSGEGYVGG